MNTDKDRGQVYRCSTRIEVQFRDLDALGHVNNAVYFSYLEMARMAYLAAIRGAPVRLSDIRTVLVDAACRYRSSALLGEMLEVGIRTSHMRRGSFAFEYRISAVADGRLIAEARTIQAVIDAQGRAVALDDAFRAQVERYEGRSFDRYAPIPPWGR